MIGRLQGILIEKLAPALLVDVQGVGYEIEAPLSTFYKLPAVGQPVLLWTHLVVREDAHLLFGFAGREERTLFRTLLRINGVGPKLALGLLSGIEPDAFIRCIEHGDVSTLTKIPGVGKKTAERLVIELRDRLKELSPVAVIRGEGANRISLPSEPTAAEEAESALVALGYKPADAQKAIAAVKNEHETAQELIRAALRRMVK
jgi:Holliday junction DNA helicase RuvA